MCVSEHGWFRLGAATRGAPPHPAFASLTSALSLTGEREYAHDVRFFWTRGREGCAAGSSGLETLWRGKRLMSFRFGLKDAWTKPCEKWLKANKF